MTSYRHDGKCSRAHNHKKNRRHRSGQSRGYHRDQGQETVTVVTPVTHIRLAIMMVSHLHPPLLHALLPVSALGLPTTRAETRTIASQAPSTRVNDSSTAVRHTRPVRRQHCRGHLRLFRKMYLLPSCPIIRHKLPLLRAHGLLGRLSQILAVQYRRRKPLSPARFLSARVQFRRREHAPLAPFPSAMA